MIVKSILSAKGRDVATIAPTATLAEATKILAERKIGALVVTGAGGRITGIVSERDMVRALRPAWRHGVAAAADRRDDPQGRDLHARPTRSRC